MKNLEIFYSVYSTKELVERSTLKTCHYLLNVLLLHSPLYLEELILLVSYKQKKLRPASSVSILELLPILCGPLPSVINNEFLSRIKQPSDT